MYFLLENIPKYSFTIGSSQQKFLTKFYKEVNIKELSDPIHHMHKFSILLDNKSIKTPSMHILAGKK